MPNSYDVVVSGGAEVSTLKSDAGKMLEARKPVATRAYTLTSFVTAYVPLRSQLVRASLVPAPRPFAPSTWVSVMGIVSSVLRSRV